MPCSDNLPSFWLVINRLAALVAINNVGVFLLYFVQEKFNLPGKQAAGLAGTLPLVLGVCVILFGLLAAWLCDYIDRRLLTVSSGLNEATCRAARAIAIDQENQRLHDNASDVIVIPDSTPEITPPLAVLPLQLLSFHMSVMRGFDPDFPRNLSKTLTVD